MPEVVGTVSALRDRTDRVRAAGGRVAFVPTMGALHEGHLSLMREARRLADLAPSGGESSAGGSRGLAVASVFVNPTQFGPHEDFTRYPRDLDADRAKARSAGIQLVFAPSVDAMYPAGERTRVVVSGLTEGLCGAFRPGHFEGVATVVTKLLSAVGPCVALFGQKDYQQLKVIERLVKDLLLPHEICGMPIVREPDGLAMSSRNAYLAPDQRRRALSLSQGLAAARERFEAGDRGVAPVREAARAPVAALMDSVDYVTLADAESLEVLPDDARIDRPAVLAVAARIGTTRLIDNVLLP